MAAPRPPYQPPKINPRVDFSIAQFEQLLKSKGSHLEWEIYRKCPCATFVSDGETSADDDLQSTGEAQSDCPECRGKGFFYDDPQPILGIALGASKNPLFYQLYGDRARGMCTLTVPAEVMLRAFDRITVLDSVISIDETRVRTGDVERCRYPIRSKTLRLGRSQHRVSELVEVDSNGTYIRRANSAGVLVAGALVEKTDYEIDDNGQLVWIDGGNIPAVGDKFSITYWANPVYIVQDMPHLHRDTIVAFHNPLQTVAHLPLNVHCWLETLGPPHGYEVQP